MTYTCPVCRFISWFRSHWEPLDWRLRRAYWTFRRPAPAVSERPVEVLLADGPACGTVWIAPEGAETVEYPCDVPGDRSRIRRVRYRRTGEVGTFGLPVYRKVS